jgi:hypothetical protein
MRAFDREERVQGGDDKRAIAISQPYAVCVNSSRRVDGAAFACHATDVIVRCMRYVFFAERACDVPRVRCGVFKQG